VWAGYLEPALRRPNLTVRTGALASRLLFQGDRCTGVEYLSDGRRHTVHARHEVVVSGGAIQSPKLLMLSGIGAPEQLAEVGVPTRVSLPGVGENFTDHPLVICAVGSRQPVRRAGLGPHPQAARTRRPCSGCGRRRPPQPG
jgi:choline dehydrogenase